MLYSNAYSLDILIEINQGLKLGDQKLANKQRPMMMENAAIIGYLDCKNKSTYIQIFE